jgi:hypothetical protein
MNTNHQIPVDAAGSFEKALERAQEDVGVTSPIPEARHVGALPRNWEHAVGYDLDEPARWLAAWWEPASDEAMYDDGRLSGTGN